MIEFSRVALRGAVSCVALASSFAGCGSSPDPEADEAIPPTALTDCCFYTGKGGDYGNLLAPIVTMHREAGDQMVQLIGSVHIADAAFYDAMVAECATADRVLTEGVRGSPDLSPFLFLTKYLFADTRRSGSLRDLAAQGECVVMPGTARNGDVELSAWQAETPLYTPLVQLVILPLVIVVQETYNLTYWIGDGLSNLCFANHEYELELRERQAKVLAHDNPDADEALDVLFPGIINDRNEQLVVRVESEFTDPAIHRIALPWGSGHLPGLIESLTKRGFVQTELRWQRCWSIRDEVGVEPAESPSIVYLPWVVHYRGFREAWSFTFAFDTISLQRRATGASRFELLWELLFSIGSSPREESSDFRVGPQFFGRPLLLERVAEKESARWRFLLFFTIGEVPEN